MTLSKLVKRIVDLKHEVLEDDASLYSDFRNSMLALPYRCEFKVLTWEVDF